MIRVTAHAKVNFFLEITGKRADGYHLLSTVFQTISLGDELTFRPAAELSMTCSEPQLPVDESNLVMRAALRLRQELQETRGAKIHLDKKVPMGAGLGGGSSDAAAVLVSLMTLWKRRLPEKALAQLAVSLGADVPFFLKGGLCRASGIGEKLTPLKPIPRTWMVLVYPGFGVATKEAYARVRLPFSESKKFSLKRFLSSFPAGIGGPPPCEIPGEGGLPAAAGDDGMLLFNRFENLVFPSYPQLPRLKQELLAAGASAALMSGSGSCVFGIVRSASQGEQILQRLLPIYPQSWLIHTL